MRGVLAILPTYGARIPSIWKTGHVPYKIERGRWLRAQGGTKDTSNKDLMVIILAIVIALGFGVGAAWVITGPKQQPDRAAEACWSMFSDTFDLDYDPGGLLQGPAINGRINEFTLTMDTFFQLRENRKQIFTRCIVKGEGLPEGLDNQSKAKPSDDPLKRMIAQVTRRHVTELVKKVGATVANGKVKWSQEGAVWDPNQMAYTVRRVVSICEFLALDASEQSAKLLHAYNDETMPDGLRNSVKQLLFEFFPGTDECESVASDMLQDGDPATRLSAAKALGEAGLPALAKLAKNPDIGKDIRESAISSLLANKSPEKVLAQLTHLIRSPSAPVSNTALGMIRRARYQPAIPVLIEYVQEAGISADKASAIVEILGAIGDESTQGVLVNLLQHSYLMVRRRAATALSRVGTPDVLPHLRQGADDGSANRRYRDLCLKAIEAIEKRHGIRDAS